MKEIQRIRLCTLPTPLIEAPRLSARLNGPRILIKRDDLTGIAMGGNKGRCLEFLITEARDMGADVIIAAGPQQSNWLCNVTAAAKKIGMHVILFLLKGNNRFQGNLLLDKLLGAEIRFTDTEISDLPAVYQQMDTLAIELRNQGHKPYILPYGDTSPLGIIGYVHLASEIEKQLQEKGITAHYLFLGSGSGCTQAGLILGVKYQQLPLKVVGVMVDPRYTKDEQAQIVANEANETARFLEMDVTFKSEEVICDDGAVGSNAPTIRSIEAVKLIAETEGIFLDPIYTGKVMAALIEQIRASIIRRDDTVILYHSGGLPAIFAYHEKLAD